MSFERQISKNENLVQCEEICIPVGSKVTARFNGSFCEATVKSLSRSVDFRVMYSDDTSNNNVLVCNESAVITLDTISRAIYFTNHRKKFHGKVIKAIDNSLYEVVFNDGDERTLKRSSINYKSNYKHALLIKEASKDLRRSNNEDSDSKFNSASTSVSGDGDDEFTNLHQDILENHVKNEIKFHANSISTEIADINKNQNNDLLTSDLPIESSHEDPTSGLDKTDTKESPESNKTNGKDLDDNSMEDEEEEEPEFSFEVPDNATVEDVIKNSYLETNFSELPLVMQKFVLHLERFSMCHDLEGEWIFMNKYIDDFHDLFNLSKIVHQLGGGEIVGCLRKWKEIGMEININKYHSTISYITKRIYTKLVAVFESHLVCRNGKMFCRESQKFQNPEYKCCHTCLNFEETEIEYINPKHFRDSNASTFEKNTEHPNSSKGVGEAMPKSELDDEENSNDSSDVYPTHTSYNNSQSDSESSPTSSSDVEYKGRNVGDSTATLSKNVTITNRRKRKCARFADELRVGMIVSVHDPDSPKRKYQAKILEIERKENKYEYFVHYKGWNSRFDEWINLRRIRSIISSDEAAFSTRISSRIGKRRYFEGYKSTDTTFVMSNGSYSNGYNAESNDGSDDYGNDQNSDGSRKKRKYSKKSHENKDDERLKFTGSKLHGIKRRLSDETKAESYLQNFKSSEVNSSTTRRTRNSMQDVLLMAALEESKLDSIVSTCHDSMVNAKDQGIEYEPNSGSNLEARNFESIRNVSSEFHPEDSPLFCASDSESHEINHSEEILTSFETVKITEKPSISNEHDLENEHDQNMIPSDLQISKFPELLTDSNDSQSSSNLRHDFSCSIRGLLKASKDLDCEITENIFDHPVYPVPAKQEPYEFYQDDINNVDHNYSKSDSGYEKQNLFSNQSLSFGKCSSLSNAHEIMEIEDIVNHPIYVGVYNSQKWFTAHIDEDDYGLVVDQKDSVVEMVSLLKRRMKHLSYVEAINSLSNAMFLVRKTYKRIKYRIQKIDRRRRKVQNQLNSLDDNNNNDSPYSNANFDNCDASLTSHTFSTNE